MIMHPPRRSMIELAHYLASCGKPQHWNPLSRQRWSVEWRLHTADLERLLRVWRTRGSTCNVHVHGLLHALGCLESWVTAPAAWPPRPNAIRLWRSDQEITHPAIEDLIPGDLLLWRAASWRAHIGVYLGTCDGLHLTSEGGQPGGVVKRRTWAQLCRQLDYSVPLDRLAWDGTSCTVGQWREERGLPTVPGVRAEDIVDEHSLELADAPEM